MVRRMLDPAANCRNLHNLGLFLGANLVARRELSTKLALPLGGDNPLDPRLENIPLQDEFCTNAEQPTPIGGRHDVKARGTRRS